jgi:threonine/homoserine/homoserine lactone efflux protein
LSKKNHGARQAVTCLVKIQSFTILEKIMSSLILFVIISTISPGGATALATASGAQFGYRRSIPLIAGIALGLASLAATSAAGLAGLFLAIPSFQMILKGTGSIYLFWLAWKIGKSGKPNLDVKSEKPISFISGAMLLWLNPKGWTMALGAAASFSSLASSPAELALILGTTFGICAIFALTIWSIAGLILARLLQTDLQWRITNVILGLLLASSIIPIWLQ